MHQIENLIHLGKNEGMFTFERYLNEYLMFHGNLTPPVKIFQPSLERTEEIVYHSPVMGDSSKLPRQISKDKKKISSSVLPSTVKDQAEPFSPTGKSLKAFIEELDKKFK
ncbi:MAG: hypothetical protein C0407_06460 [Desulfobacca sp.]|nr:hypothetical protein [Desulfobacca sp.]